MVQEWTVRLMADILRPNKTTVLRRQYIIVKADYFVTKEDAQNIKREILESLKEDGIAVVGGSAKVITVDADVLAVE